jgi:hypothetical protein
MVNSEAGFWVLEIVSSVWQLCKLTYVLNLLILAPCFYKKYAIVSCLAQQKCFLIADK